MPRKGTNLPVGWENNIQFVCNEWGAGTYMISIDFIKKYKGIAKNIGSMTVDTEDNNKVDTVYIKRKFRHKGLGYKLYAIAIERFKYLTSNFHYASDNAQAVWLKLIHQGRYKYKADFWSGRLTIYAKS